MKLKDKKIAVVYGGYSSEVEISVKSGTSVAIWLRNAGYDVYEVLLLKDGWKAVFPDRKEEYAIDLTDFSFYIDGMKIKFDKVLVFIHGDPGENGKLQAYFEMAGVPFVGSSFLSTAVVFDKFVCKCCLRDAGFHLAPDVMLRKGDNYDTDTIVSKLGLPVFVKPTQGGSSFGVTKVKKTEDLDAAIDNAFKEGDCLIIEKAINGREIDCGVYADTKGIHALPLIEIVPDNEFFDYEAKYLGASKEICPAPVSEEATRKVQEAAIGIFKRLGCTGLVRMDFMLSHEGDPYFIEVNPNPGMTPASLVPQMVRQAGMSMEEFLTNLIES